MSVLDEMISDRGRLQTSFPHTGEGVGGELESPPYKSRLLRLHLRIKRHRDLCASTINSDPDLISVLRDLYHYSLELLDKEKPHVDTGKHVTLEA